MDNIGMVIIGLQIHFSVEICSNNSVEPLFYSNSFHEIEAFIRTTVMPSLRQTVSFSGTNLIDLEDLAFQSDTIDSFSRFFIKNCWS